MADDENESLVLSKWPFYLGDLLLVATAIAIASLSNWNLSDWQAFVCVLSVALGAAVFMLPYLVEYYMRVQEESDDRQAQIRALERKIDLLQVANEDIEDRFGAISEKLVSGGRAYDLLANAVDQKVSAVESHKASVERSFAEITERVTALEGHMTTAEVGTQEMSGTVDMTSDIRVLNERMDRLNSNEKAFRETIRSLEAAVELLKAKTPQLDKDLKAGSERAESIETDIAEKVKPVAPKPVARLKRAPRSKRNSGNGLLKRAIPAKKTTKVSAVERIIGVKAEEKRKPKTQEAEPEEIVKEVVKTESEVRPGKSNSPEKKKLKKPNKVKTKPELEKEAEEKSQVVQPKEGTGPIASKDVAKAESKEESNILKKEDAEAEALKLNLEDAQLSELEEFEMTMPDVEPVPVDTPVSDEALETTVLAKEESGADSERDQVDGRGRLVNVQDAKSGAVVTAHVLIGIGNKPYVRGSGGGLNWETGVPMDFEEIGKWRWVMPEPIAEPVEIQIFRNDSDADRMGKQKVEPGAELILEPKF